AIERLAAGVGGLQTMPLYADAEEIARPARVPHAADHLNGILIGIWTQAALDHVGFFPGRVLADRESQADAAGRDIHQLSINRGLGRRCRRGLPARAHADELIRR